MSKFSRLSLSQQIACMVAVLATAVIASLVYASAHFGSATLERKAEVGLKAQLEAARRLVENAYNLSTTSADKLAGVFTSAVPGPFALDGARTMRVGSLDAPVLRAGDRVANLDFEAVDAFTRATGGVATIFARSGDDFLRVATSLKKENGERAIGTFLGKNHPAHAAMLAGSTYLGRARLFGRDYMTKYVPVRDTGGKVVAILFVGFDITEIIASVSQAVSSIRVGDSGYAFVIGTGGADKGKFVIHPKLAGTDALQLRDAAGREGFLAPLMENPDGVIRYMWNDEAGKARAKIALYARTTAFGGWSIAGGTFVDEFSADSRTLGRNLALAGLFAAIALAALVAWFVTRRLRGLGELAERMRRLGEGDLSPPPGNAADEDSRNEQHRLDLAMRRMVTGFRALIAEVRRQALDVAEASAAMTRSAEAVAGVAHSQSQSAISVGAAVEEVGASVQAVTDSAMQVRGVTERASTLAAEGAGALDAAIGRIGATAEAVDASTATLTRLDAQTQRVSGIAGIIADIAAQTNLLALNAAIEAARAGEQGRGFAVVADEVRKLAERTTASTAEIAEMVSGMRTVSDQAMKSMRDAVDHVRDGRSEADKAAVSIRSMAGESGEIARAVAEIATAMAEQTQASGEMSGNVERIVRASEETATAAADVARSARELSAIAETMTRAVRPFKLDA